MLRTLFFYAVAGPWTFICIVLGLVLGLLPGTRRLILRVVDSLWAPVWLAAAGVRLRVSGDPGSLDPSTPYVFVSNHASYFDIPATLRALTHHHPRFVAKRELLFIPLLNLFMLRIGTPIVDRGRRSQTDRTFDRAVERIRSGTPVLVYAEGTRTRDGEVAAFKRGAFILAIRARVPIVPITVDGSFHVMKRKTYRVFAGPIHVHVGEPISTEGLVLDDRKELTTRVRDVIVGQLDEMRGRTATG